MRIPRFEYFVEFENIPESHPLFLCFKISVIDFRDLRLIFTISS